MKHFRVAFLIAAAVFVAINALILCFDCGALIALAIAAAILVVATVIGLLAFFDVVPNAVEDRVGGFYVPHILIGLLVAALVSSYCLLLPISDLKQSFPENILANIVYVAKMMIFSLNFNDIIASSLNYANYPNCLMLDSATARLVYGLLLEVLSIASPILFATGLISLLYGNIPYLRARWGSEHNRDVYVFLGINNQSLLLAKDIIVHARKASRKPYFCFAECSKNVRDDESLQMQELRGLAHRRISFLDWPIHKIPLSIKKSSNIWYFLLSDDHAHNIESAIEIQNTLADYATSQMSENETLEAAGRIRIVCLHSNREGELILDSSQQHFPSDRQILDRKGRPIDNPSEAFRADYIERWKKARQAITLRLVREEEEHVWHLLSQQPLFTTLDQEKLISGEHQTLNIAIVGLGAMGLEILKTCYWLGRLRNTSLHILAVDMQAEEIKDKLSMECPEMLDDFQSDNMATITFLPGDIFSDSCQKEIAARMPIEGSYIFVATGSDECSMDAAIELRRFIDEVRIKEAQKEISRRQARGEKVESAGVDPDARITQIGRIPDPTIAVNIQGNEAARAINHLKSDKGEDYNFVCFGNDDQIYTWENFVEAKSEKQAVRMNGVYDLIYAFGNEPSYEQLHGGVDVSSTLSKYNEFEIKKRSNRAGVLYIPYRAWTLGLRPDDYEDEGKWFESLGLANLAEDLPEVFRSAEGDSKQAYRDALKQRIHVFATNYPLLWELARVEHDRWLAFYQSQGWQGITTDEMWALNLVNAKGKRVDGDKFGQHQSPKMRKHCYMCDFDELESRGAELRNDPYVNDLVMVAYSCFVLNGKEIFATDARSLA